MPRNARASHLETRTSRLKLPVAGKPHYIRVGLGASLGYRRNKSESMWVARIANGKGGHKTMNIGRADDLAEADGGAVLDFWQAQERARALARGGAAGASDDGKLWTVTQALDNYETDLKLRGADVASVARLRLHIDDGLARRTVALLTSRELSNWRNRLAKSKLAPASINRVCSIFRAALNLAARQDERIVSQRAWERGLAMIPDASEARNVILGENDVRQVIASAYAVEGEAFGLYVETAAVSGARPAQLARIEIADLQADRAEPRIMMPSSKKGRGVKKILRRPVPIPAGLAAKLKRAAGGRRPSAPLLTKMSGGAWRKSDQTRPFRRVAKHAGLDPGEVTPYALRHSSIVRALLAHVPTRVVAVNHDTSVAMIEKNYSKYIADHSDAVARRGLLDTSEPAGGNVVSLAVKSAS